MDQSLDLVRTYGYVCCEENHKTLLTNDLATPNSAVILACQNNPSSR